MQLQEHGCNAIRVSEDVLFAIHDCALGMSPVTSDSGVKSKSVVWCRLCCIGQCWEYRCRH